MTKNYNDFNEGELQGTPVAWNGSVGLWGYQKSTFLGPWCHPGQQYDVKTLGIFEKQAGTFAKKWQRAA